MSLITNFFARMTTLWTLYSYVMQVNLVLKNYPGTENEIRLRAWLLDNLALLSGLAIKTANPVDDTVVRYTLRIIENDSAWKILFGMLSFSGFLRLGAIEVPKETSNTVVYGETDEAKNDCIRSLYEIDASLKQDVLLKGNTDENKEPAVQNPILIISAVGLIFQILQYLRARK